MNRDGVHLEALVQAVTDEMYKKLKLKDNISRGIKKKKLVIMSVESESALEARLGKHFDIAYYNEQTRAGDIIIIPTICIQLLSNLANGISAGNRERYLLTMLLKGKKVIALDEGLIYRKYKETAPKLLYNMYATYTEKLVNYGIQIVKETELLRACSNTDSDQSRAILTNHTPSENRQSVGHNPGTIASTSIVTGAPAREKTANEAHKARQAGSTRSLDVDNPFLPRDIMNKKLITEADLKKYYLHQINEVVISKNSIITPLAQDYLRTNQMVVHRR